MINLKYKIHVKTMAVLITAVFVFQNSCYGFSEISSEKPHLRKPLDFNNRDESPRYLHLIRGGVRKNTITGTNGGNPDKKLYWDKHGRSMEAALLLNEEYLKDIRVSQENVAEEINDKGGAEILFNDWLEQGRALTSKKLNELKAMVNNGRARKVTYRDINPKSIELIEEGICSYDRWIKFSFFSNKRFPDFLLLYDEYGELKEIFIGTVKNQKNWFVGISDNELLNELGAENKKIIAGIRGYLEGLFKEKKRYISKDPADEKIKDAVYRAMVPADLGTPWPAYSIKKPVFSSARSRSDFLKLLEDNPAFGPLTYFLYKKYFPIPENMICVERGAENVEGRVYFEGAMLINEDSAWRQRDIDDLCFSLAEDIFSKPLMAVVPSQDGEYRERFLTYRKYFQGALSDYFAGSPKVFASMLIGLFVFRNYNNIVPELRDVKFLSEIAVIPRFFWPEGFLKEDAELYKEATLESYYLPLIIHLYGHDEKDNALSIFNSFGERYKNIINRGIADKIKKCDEREMKNILISLLFMTTESMIGSKILVKNREISGDL
jgi:hypothetical protein